MSRSRFRISSFRVQVAVAFGVLVIALAAGVSLVLGSMLASKIRANAASALQVVASNAARQLADGLAERLTLVRSLAESESLWEAGLDSPAVQRTLAREQAIRADLAWIGVAGLDGRVRSATGNLLQGADVHARPWFPAGLQGPAVGDVHPAKLLAGLLPKGLDGEPQRFVDFSAPVRGGGKTLGVLAIHGSWDWSRRVIDSLLPPDADARGLSVFVFDRHGVLIHAPGGATARLVAAGQRLPIQPGGGVAAVSRWVDADAYLTSTAALPANDPQTDLGWRIVARVPASAAFAEARTAAWQALGVGGVASVAAAVLAWCATGCLSRPLAAIARAADAVDRGVPGAHIPTFTHNRELARASGALAAMTRGLLASKEVLETRVAGSTAELQAANRDLERLSRYDALTQVLNRCSFEKRLDFALAQARRRRAPVSMVTIDIDRFKHINDRHGHAVGDRVLQKVAEVLRARLRECDTVGRLCGDEFALLLPDTDHASAKRFAECLAERVATTPIPGVEVGVVTLRCSVAHADGGADGFAALKASDVTLRRAEAHGRHRVEFPHATFGTALV